MEKDDKFHNMCEDLVNNGTKNDIKGNQAKQETSQVKARGIKCYQLVQRGNTNYQEEPKACKDDQITKDTNCLSKYVTS